MRIKYNMSNNYFKCYNEFQGILLSRNEVLKKNYKPHNYIERGIINLISLLFMFLISKFLYYIDNNNIFTKILDVLIILILCIMVLYFVLFFVGYFSEKRKVHIGNLEIDSEGIKDFSSSGTIIGFSWKNIKAIVIKKNTINIITDGTLFIFIDITYKDRFLNAINRYNPNLPIIDNSR